MHTQVTAVYADILGFTQLVTSQEGFLDLLDGFMSSESSESSLRLAAAEENYLARMFTTFHCTLDLQLRPLQNIDPLKSIAFSDSALVAFRDNNIALSFAGNWMRMLLSFRIPVRMGIGTGSFRVLRLTTDVSDDVQRHSAQFLGTAVVQAYQAESCGLKGMRIFIHPDATVAGDWDGHFCDVHENTPNVKTRVNQGVNRELNYCRYVPDFILNSEQQKNAEAERAELAKTGSPKTGVGGIGADSAGPRGAADGERAARN